MNPAVGTIIGATIGFLSSILTYFALRNNLNKEHEFRKEQENIQFLRQRKEEIFIILKRDYDRLIFVLNSYRTFGPEKGIDEIGGYEMNISEAVIYSNLYFPDLYKEIVDYEESLRSFFDIELRKGFKSSAVNEISKNLYPDDPKNEEKRKEISNKYNNLMKKTSSSLLENKKEELKKLN